MIRFYPGGISTANQFILLISLTIFLSIMKPKTATWAEFDADKTDKHIPKAICRHWGRKMHIYATSNQIPFRIWLFALILFCLYAYCELCSFFHELIYMWFSFLPRWFFSSNIKIGINIINISINITLILLKNHEFYPWWIYLRILISPLHKGSNTQTNWWRYGNTCFPLAFHMHFYF